LEGAFELAYLLENTNNAPYKYEVYDILTFCFDNYKEEMAIFLNILIDALQWKRLMP
jgi:hypothetical protein